MPPVFDVTTPAPVPLFDAASWNCCTAKLALTKLADHIVTLHGPVPKQAPDHPVKVEPTPAAALSVTGVPSRKLAKQAEGQPMPGPVTVPLPETAAVSCQ